MLGNKLAYATLLLFSFYSTLSCSNSNTIWLSHTKNSADFFGDGSQSINPEGYALGYSKSFNSDWQVSLSYAELDDKTQWLTLGEDLPTVVDHADSETKNTQLSLGWMPEDYMVSFAYSQIEATERALTRLPAIAEITQTKDNIVNINYDGFHLDNQWTFNWTLGVQYADSKSDNLQIFFVNPITSVGTRFNQTIWSAITSFSSSYEYAYYDILIAPGISISWNTELSSSGEPLVLITRGDQRHLFNQFSDRQIGTLRTPDSGLWDFSINIAWSEHISTRLSYGQSISAPVKSSGTSVELSVYF
ncbi:hypothetical protein [Aliikangiella sp. IMCC44632]